MSLHPFTVKSSHATLRLGCRLMTDERQGQGYMCIIVKTARQMFYLAESLAPRG